MTEREPAAGEESLGAGDLHGPGAGGGGLHHQRLRAPDWSAR